MISFKLSNIYGENRYKEIGKGSVGTARLQLMTELPDAGI